MGSLSNLEGPSYRVCLPKVYCCRMLTSPVRARADAHDTTLDIPAHESRVESPGAAIEADLVVNPLEAMCGMCSACVPVSHAEPEVQTFTLTSEDEFLVLACDGLWDVMSSQRCMELARTHLRDNNDPQLCAEHLVSIAADLVTYQLPPPARPAI